MSEDEAKCYISSSKTQGAARKWVNEQEDELMKDLKSLKEAFIKRSPAAKINVVSLPVDCGSNTVALLCQKSGPTKAH